MDLVEEQDRAPPVLAETVAGTLDHLAHVLHAGGDRGELLERPLGGAGDRQRERRLACAGRAPEDRAGEPILLDKAAQRLARPHQVRLPDDIVERARAQPRGQRRLGAQAVLGGGAEQIRHYELPSTRWYGPRRQAST